MPQELTLETLGKNIADINVKLASFMADHTEEEKEKKEAKTAQDDKEDEEKKEAKKTAALKKAMEEKDPKERDAAIKKAMDEHEDAPKTEKKDEKTAQDDKEEKEHVASIISDARKDYVTKILTANSIMNPTGQKEVEARLKKASFTEIKKEWAIWQPAFEGATQQPTPQEKFVPYFANITPADIDNTTLTAASPDSEFAKFTTKELLEMSR